ncbi:MAG: Glycosyl transferase, family 4 [Candidatus Peregrinibacteria bacterium GW2011_GWA2_44_7]|nr:MAG: Glycosyl transferase, family 4 [Candidatus Peregrinibacteria bacterium GW2011_GWA2_44_7]
MSSYISAFQPYLLPALTSFGLAFLGTFSALRLFPKLKLMDRPHLYGLKRAPIPYSGGLVLFLMFLVNVLLFMDLNKHVLGVLFAVTLIVGVSFLDDRYRLSPLLRLGVQVVAATIVVLFGMGIDVVTNPFGGLIHLDGLEFPLTLGNTVYHFTLLADLFTVIWIVAMINTVNWLDGLPGLVSGISCIASFILFLLSVRPNFHYINQAEVSILAIILFGITAAFWWFDFSPPKILMGDTGSMFLGFMLAILAIFSGGKIATTFLIMGFPLLDAFWVILRRLFQGKSPFKGDLYHFHHRLLRVGLSDRQSIVSIYLISGVFGFIALFLESKEKLIAIAVLALFTIALGTFVVYRSHQNR